MRTLLIGHPGVTWRGWLKENRGTSDLICLDPADHQQPRPAQLTLFEGEQPKAWRFYGSLDGSRAPHVLIAAVVRFLEAAPASVFIQAPAYRSSPVARQTALLLAEATRPDRIFIAEGAGLSAEGFTTGPEVVPLEAGFPPLVETAQRKARWMGFIERASEQDVLIGSMTIEGARFGSGQPLSLKELERLLPSAAHAEFAGGTLFVVGTTPLDDSDASCAMNSFQATRLHTAVETDYEDLVCSLARGSGEDFAFGIIRKIDFRRGTATIVSDAIPPATATILRLGSLKVDAKGNERGETRPWTL